MVSIRTYTCYTFFMRSLGFADVTHRATPRDARDMREEGLPYDPPSFFFLQLPILLSANQGCAQLPSLSTTQSR